MKTTPRPRVIVGVDRSLCGLAALRTATVEAARRGVPLCVVQVCSGLGAPHDLAEIDMAFAEALGGLPREVEVQRELAVAPVAAALARRVRCPGDLLVVGESGRGWWHALWAGSVSRGCLRRARCPVLAVPAPEMARTVWHRSGWWPHRAEDVWQRFEDEQPSLRG
jgi:nucleotide-binding universal stress UspA family protein